MHGTLIRKKRNARSAITNGSRLFAQRVDLRTSRGSRFKDLIDTYSNSIGPTLTEPQRVLIRDLAMLQVLAEDLQQKYMEDGVLSAEDHTQYSRLSTNIKSNLKRLGLLSMKASTDDDDETLSPLDYVKRGKPKPRRERLEDDDD